MANGSSGSYSFSMKTATLRCVILSNSPTSPSCIGTKCLSNSGRSSLGRISVELALVPRSFNCAQSRQQFGKMSTTFSLNRNELHAESLTRRRAAHNGVDLYGTFLYQEVQIRHLALRKWLVYFQKHSARADVANSRNIHTPSTLPVSPDLAARFDTRRESAARRHTVDQNLIPPLPSATFRREPRTGASFLKALLALILRYKICFFSKSQITRGNT